MNKRYYGTDAPHSTGPHPDPMSDFCIICANGNDLPEGEECPSCGRKGYAVGLRAAVIKARGRPWPPSTPVEFS